MGSGLDFLFCGVEEGVEGLHLLDDRGALGAQPGEVGAAEEREREDAQRRDGPLPALEEEEGEVPAEGEREAGEEAEGETPREAGGRAEGDPGEGENASSWFF